MMTWLYDQVLKIKILCVEVCLWCQAVLAILQRDMLRCEISPCVFVHLRKEFWDSDLVGCS